MEALNTCSAYDGWQVIEERNALDQVTASYVYSDLDEPVAMVKSGVVYYYHYNHQGSIEAITDSSGNVLERYSYDPFGKVTITDVGGTVIPETQIGNPYYFTGRRLDTETGLYYYRNRYYNPELDRFTSLDPLGYIDSMNMYAYALSDPINKDDPFGLLEPGANELQRDALCNGQSDCKIDMTPRTPEEARFQQVVGGGLVGMFAVPAQAALVAAYGPTALAALGNFVATNPVTAGTVGFVLSNPSKVTDFVGGYVSGFTAVYSGWRTKLPPKNPYEALGSLSGQLTGALALRLKESFNGLQPDIINRSSNAIFTYGDAFLNSDNNREHPKK